jgi:allophanate hydrolase subunit 1/allophanate hydrolase subunit 2
MERADVKLAPLGPAAWRLTLERPPTRALRDALSAIDGLEDFVLCEGAALLAFAQNEGPSDTLLARIADAVGIADAEGFAGACTTHVLRVVYDGEDLSSVAAATGLTVDAVIHAHAEREYTVRATGFLPGFAYLGELDPRLRRERRASPRARVPAGAVAIAEDRTAVYPLASPGGWHLLGRLADDWRAFDAERGETLCLGDRVRWIPVPSSAHEPGPPPTRGPSEEPPDRGGRALRIVASEAPALVQDGGRPGWMRAGIARGGALWKGRLAKANRALGQRWDAPAIELFGAIRVRAEGGDVRVSLDGRAFTVREGETAEIPRPRRARVQYLAVEGGVRARLHCGGVGQWPRAGLGGIDGARDRPLRRGDRIPIEDGREAFAIPARPEPVESGEDDALEMDFVLQVHPFTGSAERFAPAALDALCAEPVAIRPESDRTGMRLSVTVPRRDRDGGASAPMCEGAIEVSADGTPIVLAVDHPVTGGYPVLAVLDPAHRGPLHARRPGARVRFALAR